jgi:hypothetical protein
MASPRPRTHGRACKAGLGGREVFTIRAKTEPLLEIVPAPQQSLLLSLPNFQPTSIALYAVMQE